MTPTQHKIHLTELRLELLNKELADRYKVGDDAGFQRISIQIAELTVKLSDLLAAACAA